MVLALRTDFTPRLEYRFGTKLWSLIPGCEPPLPKKVESKEDVSESTKNYEKNKRQRAFQNSWKQGRTWLVFNDNAIFCSVVAAVDATLTLSPPSISDGQYPGHWHLLRLFLKMRKFEKSPFFT